MPNGPKLVHENFDDVTGDAAQVLKDALETVRRGEVNAVTVVLSMNDGSWRHTTSSQKDTARHIGALELVKARVLQNWMEE